MRKSSLILGCGFALALAGSLGAGCTINSKSGTGGLEDDTAGNGNGSGNGSGDPSGTGGSSSSSYSSAYGGAGTTVGVGSGSVLPSDCDPASGDDACGTCAKTSCCAEIEACTADTGCVATYKAFNDDCLFPAGEWSGYDTNYCKKATGADKGLAAAVIDCFKTQCGTDDKCGVEHVDTWNNFAAEFVDVLCAGCHHPEYSSPLGCDPQTEDNCVKTTSYTTDPAWFEPLQDNWLGWMDYNAVVTDNDLFWCGLATQADGLPPECAAFTWPTTEGLVTAGNPRFTKAERFPPIGGVATDHFGNQLHCWWNDDGTTCEQPDAVTRRRFISWIVNENPM